MTLTEEQQAIIATATGPASRITAYAGTGKTQTLQLYSERNVEPTLYLAFNKSVQTEAQRRFPYHVRCQTIHSLAFTAMRPRGEIKGFISFFDVARLLQCQVEQAVDVVDTLEAFMRSDKFEITADTCPFRFEDDPMDLEIRTACAAGAKRVYAAMKQGTFPITHGFYLKEYQLTKPRIITKTILLDEAQDTNPVILDIIRRQSCRIIAVGDPFQQIYGFTGAIDAMERLKGDNFFLTKSFRFGPALASAASMFLEHFYELQRPLMGLETAETRVITHSCPDEAETMQRPYTHIFRSNAGLFESAIGYSNRGLKIALTGGDTFNTFLDDLRNLFFVYNNQLDMCRQPLYKAFKGWDGLKHWAESRNEVTIIGKMEIVETHGEKLPQVIERVRAAVVPDPDADILLVTAHRAKGMQWDRVRLADDFMFLTDEHGAPLKLANGRVKGDSVFTHIDSNEAHLIYVAMTRAMKEVRLCKSFMDVIQARPNEVLKRMRDAQSMESVHDMHLGDTAEEDDSD